MKGECGFVLDNKVVLIYMKNAVHSFPWTPYCSFSTSNTITSIVLTQRMHSEFEEHINNGILASEYTKGFTLISYYKYTTYSTKAMIFGQV